jgi:uncharacterized membrane protein HdeD (DUF308 family)
MTEALKRYWWVPVIRGICGIVFGVIAFAYPSLALATLVLLFGAWVLIDGVFHIVGATAGRASGAVEIAFAIKLRKEMKGEWFLILMGLASILFIGSASRAKAKIGETKFRRIIVRS